jgi:hypothetical protein
VPIFLGANPAEVRHGDVPIIRPCGEEEDAARELLASLDAEQRPAAVLCERAPPDFVLTNAPLVPDSCLPRELAPPLLARLFDGMREDDRETLRLDVNAPRGLPAAHMHGAQRDLLRRLIDVYADRLPQPLAAAERARIDDATVHFAWAGGDRRGDGHYYRLHGPSFLVECDNTQDNANHVHSVWRSPDRDFGRDLLRLHLGSAHLAQRPQR